MLLISTGFKHDLNRNALDHLHVVACGVLGGEERNVTPAPAMMLSTFPLKTLQG